MKRILALVLALCLCIGLGCTALADFVITSDQIWIYDGQSDDYDSSFYSMNSDHSGKGWSWKASSKTLTLNGFQGFFDFEAVNGPLTVTLALTPGTDNIVTGHIQVMTENIALTTLVVTGKGKLSIAGSVCADVLDISDAEVVVNNSVRGLVMRSGSLTAGRCEPSYRTERHDAYYGGSISLGGGSEAAFRFYVGDGKTSAYANVPATDANGNPLTFGTCERYEDSYQGYLNADGTPATTVRIGGGAPSTPSTPTQPEQPSRTGFSDVADDDWFASSVEWAVTQGITNGMGDGTFAPEITCTQAHIITFICRAARGVPEEQKNPFGSKVDTSQYYYEPMLWAYQRGVLTDADLDIDPNASCSRKDVVTYLWRLYKCPQVSDTASFSDVPADADYAQAVAWAVARGITDGMGNNQFQPDAICNRAQIVTFLDRALHAFHPST